jgi:hypothetical protein
MKPRAHAVGFTVDIAISMAISEKVILLYLPAVYTDVCGGGGGGARAQVYIFILERYVVPFEQPLTTRLRSSPSTKQMPPFNINWIGERNNRTCKFFPQVVKFYICALPSIS